MKFLLSICMLAIPLFAMAKEMPANHPRSDVVSGVVLEVKNVKSFSYLRLKTTEGVVWAAVMSAPVKVGDAIAIEDAVLMTDFESKAMNRTFPSIIIGTLRGADSSSPGSGMSEEGETEGTVTLGKSFKIAPPVKPEPVKIERVEKAAGKLAHTVEEINRQADALKDKPVVVRGKVVKYNANIMDKNWVHLRDGTGVASEGTDDILITTGSEVAVGEVVTMKGIVRNNRDYGAGYVYRVLIEDATLEK